MEVGVGGWEANETLDLNGARDSFKSTKYFKIGFCLNDAPITMLLLEEISREKMRSSLRWKCQKEPWPVP